MSAIETILQDWSANRRNPKAQLFLASFRLAQMIRNGGRISFILGVPYLLFHRIFFEWLWGIELPWGTKVGKGLRIFHGVGLVVNDRSIIGEGVILRHCTTLGVKETGEFGTGEAPKIGNYVDIGSNTVILGGVTVGDYAVIGAGAVIVEDIPDGAIVVGNPGRIIKYRVVNL